MNRKRVLELAAWACIGTRSPGLWECSTEALELFAEMVTRVEREACARVCEELREDWLRGRGRYDEFKGDSAGECADAIRARGKE